MIRRLDKKVILDTAARMADEEGIINVTLKSLAERLGVKSPSLYKHISGLDELNKELMLYGWDLLEKEIMKATVGKAKDDAVIALCYTFRNFVASHRGLFEAMQWYNMYQTNEHLQATEGLVSVLFAGEMIYGVIGIINLIFISLIFSLLTMYFQNIWATCGLHSFWDFFRSYYGHIGKRSDSDTHLRQSGNLLAICCNLCYNFTLSGSVLLRRAQCF